MDALREKEGRLKSNECWLAVDVIKLMKQWLLTNFSDNLQSITYAQHTHTSIVVAVVWTVMNSFHWQWVQQSIWKEETTIISNLTMYTYHMQSYFINWKQWMKSQDFCCKMQAEPIKIAKWLIEFALIVHIYSEVIFDFNG